MHRFYVTVKSPTGNERAVQEAIEHLPETAWVRAHNLRPGSPDVLLVVEDDQDLTDALNAWFALPEQNVLIPGYGYPEGSLLFWHKD